MFGAAVKALLGTLASHIGVSGFKFQLLFQSQLPAEVPPGSSR